MKSILLLLLVGTVIAFDYVSEFKSFKLEYDRSYATQADESFRFEVFQQNLEVARQLNDEQPNAEFGVTQFSDLTYEEFKQRWLGLNTTEVNVPPELVNAADELDPNLLAPTVVDWRKHGAVTPIKKQRCGTCWAFSATETLESQWFLKHGKLYNLSAAEIAACSKENGCLGGFPKSAMLWVSKNGGVTTEHNYPVDRTWSKDNEPKCDDKKWKGKTVVNCTGVKDAGTHDENAMMKIVASQGPISVNVATDTWKHYKSGVLQTCGTKTDHAVGIVGYDSAANPPYWIVRNSWGTRFGERGYINIEMGKKLPNGMCNINNAPVIPTM